VALGPGGKITGILTDKTTGRPLRDGCVETVSLNGLYTSFTTTGKNGRYILNALNTASYRLEAGPCFTGGANLAEQVRPGAIGVTAGRTRSGIGLALTPGGSVSGTLLAGSPPEPQDMLCVDIVPKPGGLGSGIAISGQGGTFTATNVLPGRYTVFLGDPLCGFGFASQWYDHRPTAATATTVTVRAGRTTRLARAALADDGQISGTVTGPAPGHAPLTGACVTAVPTGPGPAGTGPFGIGQPVVTAVTSRGDYSVIDLAPGRYRVVFQSGCGVSGFATQWWRHAASKAKATVITVTAGAHLTGVSAALRR
jgi:hypothetical protein